MVDGSYDLLFDEERRVFERMSVFAGACPLEAAEQVCAGDPVGAQNVADLLARLVDKSLVTATLTDRGIRFGVLKTLPLSTGRNGWPQGVTLPTCAPATPAGPPPLADVPAGAHSAGPGSPPSASPSTTSAGAIESALASEDADHLAGASPARAWLDLEHGRGRR